MVLDMDPVQALREDFALPKVSEEHPEWPRHVQRTAAHILLAGLAFVDARVSESDSRDVLGLLSTLLSFVLEEDLDELLRSVTLDAVFLLGQTCTTGELVTSKGKAAVNGSDQDQLAEDTKSALQVSTRLLLPRSITHRKSDQTLARCLFTLDFDAALR